MRVTPSVSAHAAGGVIIAALFGLAWGGPIVATMIGGVDFPFYIAAAETFADGGGITVPHFLLQVLLGAFIAAGVESPQSAALIFFSALYMAAAAVVCWFVGRRCVGVVSSLVASGLAIAVIMSAPIVPQNDMELFLIGYFPPNVYHNPTMLLARPLLVLVLASAVAAMTHTGKLAMSELIALATPAVLLGLAKPNYLGCLIPSLAAAVVIDRLPLHDARTRTASHGHVSGIRVAVVCGAALIALGITYLLYRSEQRFETGIVFAPLAVVGHYSAIDAWTIATSILVSFAFPLAVSVLWPRSVWRDPAMCLAWAGAVIGLLFSYLAAEAGPRRFDGNFLWTGQMGAFVLFVAAAAFVHARVMAGGGGRPDSYARWASAGRALVAIAVLLLHVEAGIRHALFNVDRDAWRAFFSLSM